MSTSVRILGAIFIVAGAFSPSPVQAQSVSVNEVVGLYRNDTVRVNTPIMFKLRFTNPEALNFAISNGFEIYSPDGAVWDHAAVRGDTLTGAIPRSNWDLNFSMNVFLGTETPPADTVGILGARINSPGLSGGFNGVPYGVYIGPLDSINDGFHICIDSAWFRPGGTWKWVAQGGAIRYPTWGGPYCYLIYKVPDLKPSISNPTSSLTGRHCQTISYDFNATDPEGETVTFEKISGPGSINATTGVWNWLPGMAYVGQPNSIEIRPCEPHGCGPSITVSINVTNETPTFTAGCRDTTWVTPGSTSTKDMNGSDGCNDPLHFALGPVTPAFDGTVSINASTGMITFTSTSLTPLAVYGVEVYVSDNRDSALCSTYFRVTNQCCIGRRGNVSGDPGDYVDISDLMALVTYLFLGGPLRTPCVDEANIDASPDRIIDIGDLQKLVDYLFFGGPYLPQCPS